MNHLELKKIRKNLRFSQAEMAEKVGVTLSGYQKYEYGDRKIPQTVCKIIDTLTDSNSQENAKPINNGKIGLGDAIDFILENIEEAEKIPSFAMYLKTVFQEGEKSANLEHLNRLLKLKENE